MPPSILPALRRADTSVFGTLYTLYPVAHVPLERQGHAPFWSIAPELAALLPAGDRSVDHPELDAGIELRMRADTSHPGCCTFLECSLDAALPWDLTLTSQDPRSVFDLLAGMLYHRVELNAETFGLARERALRFVPFRISELGLSYDVISPSDGELAIGIETLTILRDHADDIRELVLDLDLLARYGYGAPYTDMTLESQLSVFRRIETRLGQLPLLRRLRRSDEHIAFVDITDACHGAHAESH